MVEIVAFIKGLGVLKYVADYAPVGSAVIVGLMVLWMLAKLGDKP